MEGGLFCGIDLKTGRLFSPKVFKGPIVEDVVVHPDTHVPIEGELPRWGVMLESIQEMCRHVPTLRYLGFDIIITESSFKVIEINSLSGISYIQLFYPFLANPLGRQFFQALGAKN